MQKLSLFRVAGLMLAMSLVSAIIADVLPPPTHYTDSALQVWFGFMSAFSGLGAMGTTIAALVDAYDND